MKEEQENRLGCEEKKIEEIINYFDAWRDKLYNYYLKEDYHQKHSLSFSGTLFAGFVVLLSPFVVYLYIEEVNKVISLMISFLLIALCYILFHYVYFSSKTKKRYFLKIYKIDIILEFLWHIKISRNIKNINLLIKEFSKGLVDYRRIYSVDYENIKLDEFIDAIDKLNSEIIKNEKS